MDLFLFTYLQPGITIKIIRRNCMKQKVIQVDGSLIHKNVFSLLLLMSLFITSLNSGSNGNCYYIGNDTEAIFIDAGIPCIEIEKRMKRLGLSMHKVKGVFISHEHTDHTSGV